MWQDRISIDPKVMVGKPVIKGTRLPVELIVGFFANGWSMKEVLGEYQGITEEDVKACFAYAQYALQQEKIYPILQNAA
ncbi:MAG: DUF433 domain-containing protein [Bacteroidetes bacterium]|nr:MAG: DUF433 domain-containing protein [Bacteroidota bacterium]